MMAALEAARDALAQIDGIASCKVGLEPNISPADYPLIRVVPVRAVAGKSYHSRTIEALIYFGTPVAKSEGMEQVYTELSDMEESIMGVVRGLQGRYVETIFDEDVLDAYKLMAIRCELSAENVAPS